MSITITVSGSASGSFAPEEAEVFLAVTSQGADRSSVVEHVATGHARLAAELTQLADAGTVTTWSSGTVQTYSHRPQDPAAKGGRAAKLVHVASVPVQATFGDLGALSPTVDTWMREPTISLRSVQWRLEKGNRQLRIAEVRTEAVQNAVVKAQSYADALGAGPVEPVEIADAGMLPGTGGGGGAAPMMATSARFGTEYDQQDAVELRPRDIEVDVAVDARFIAAPRATQ